MKNSGKFQNSMRAVTINSEFSLPGLICSVWSLGLHYKFQLTEYICMPYAQRKIMLYYYDQMHNEFMQSL